MTTEMSEMTRSVSVRRLNRPANGHVSVHFCRRVCRLNRPENGHVSVHFCRRVDGAIWVCQAAFRGLYAVIWTYHGCGRVRRVRTADSLLQCAPKMGACCQDLVPPAAWRSWPPRPNDVSLGWMVVRLGGSAVWLTKTKFMHDRPGGKTSNWRDILRQCVMSTGVYCRHLLYHASARGAGFLRIPCSDGYQCVPGECRQKEHGAGVVVVVAGCCDECQ